MRTYTIETIGKIILTLTDKKLAEIFFEQHKAEYNFLELSENSEVNGNTFKKSLEIFRKQVDFFRKTCYNFYRKRKRGFSKMTRTINNFPKYAEDKKYIVAREIDGELWFYGAYDESNKANEIALEIGGVTLQN